MRGRGAGGAPGGEGWERGKREVQERGARAPARNPFTPCPHPIARPGRAVWASWGRTHAHTLRARRGPRARRARRGGVEGRGWATRAARPQTPAPLLALAFSFSRLSPLSILSFLPARPTATRAAATTSSPPASGAAGISSFSTPSRVTRCEKEWIERRGSKLVCACCLYCASLSFPHAPLSLSPLLSIPALLQGRIPGRGGRDQHLPRRLREMGEERSDGEERPSSGQRVTLSLSLSPSLSRVLSACALLFPPRATVHVQTRIDFSTNGAREVRCARTREREKAPPDAAAKG